MGCLLSVRVSTHMLVCQETRADEWRQLRPAGCSLTLINDLRDRLSLGEPRCICPWRAAADKHSRLKREQAYNTRTSHSKYEFNLFKVTQVQTMEAFKWWTGLCCSFPPAFGDRPWWFFSPSKLICLKLGLPSPGRRHELFQMCKKYWYSRLLKTTQTNGNVGGGEIKSRASGMAPFFYLKTLGEHLRQEMRRDSCFLLHPLQSLWTRTPTFIFHKLLFYFF